MNLKKYWKYLIISGIIIAVAGIIFTMQSNSIVGPSSSFMYNNPEWTNNGFVIIVIGAILIIIGGILLQIKKKKRIDLH
ncbi:MAG: LPXTG cell wall anchor domain-containing protein [Candidatus Nitrosocosmicus sp.]